MVDLMGELDASIQAKLDADTDFQTAIASLSDEEKTTKITERKSEEFNKELGQLKEKADAATKAQELADNYKVRAEKAEARKESPKVSGDLSQKDILYLAKSDIHEEDLDGVLEWAKLKKIPVAKAKEEMQPILDKHSEERRTAAVTHTKGGARGSSQVSGEDLLARAERGEEIPDDQDSMNALFQARLARKTSKFKRR